MPPNDRRKKAAAPPPEIVEAMAAPGRAVVQLVPPASPPTKRGVRLHSLDSIRLEHQRVYRAAKEGRMTLADACRLSFLLSNQGKLHEASVLEARLTALERQLTGNGSG